MASARSPRSPRWTNLHYYRANFRKIIATRERLSRELTALGFDVLPSQTNFILVASAAFPGETLAGQTARQKNPRALVQPPVVRNYLRITIGTDAEAAALLRAASMILKAGKK